MVEIIKHLYFEVSRTGTEIDPDSRVPGHTEIKLKTTGSSHFKKETFFIKIQHNFTHLKPKTIVIF